MKFKFLQKNTFKYFEIFLIFLKSLLEEYNF